MCGGLDQDYLMIWKRVLVLLGLDCVESLGTRIAKSELV